MRAARELIVRAGRSDAPVLLLGGTGTGKEVAARALHAVSGRAPFVTIDCSALATPLLESELFGYTKGAFTGATSARRGLAEAANGGTAFFDEIGELPLDQQAKLLRLLEEKEFRPLGATLPKKSDFRVIAATNRDLAAEARQGRFREDLYYRLKVITLRLPPLRDHMEDIPLLVQHFLGLYGHGRSISVSAEAMQVLFAYTWPGNVRELANCVHAMVALNSEATLRLEDLPDELRGKGPSRPEAGQYGRASSGESVKAAETFIPLLPLAELERMAVTQALRRLHGNCGEVARLLGIGRTTLYRKLKEYKIGFDVGADDRHAVSKVHPPAGRSALRVSRNETLSHQCAPFAPLALAPLDCAVELLRLQEVEFGATPHLIVPASAPLAVAAVGSSQS